VIQVRKHDETHISEGLEIDHPDTLFSTKSLKNEQKYFSIKRKLNASSFKLYLFINSVKQNHKPTI